VEPFNGEDSVLAAFLKNNGDVYNGKESSLEGRNT
jgi:hypothetical protein